MKIFPGISILTAALLMASTNPLAYGANYQIDAAHTSVIFGASHLGYSYTYGRFNEVKGTFQWDGQDLENSKFQVQINPASIDTNDAKRDEHLKGPDFFNVKQFTELTFQSTEITPSDNENMYNVKGNLTMHGVTKEITLPLELLKEGETQFGDYRAGFNSQTELKRSDFGMSNMIPNISDEVAITISFEGVRQ